MKQCLELEKEKNIKGLALKIRLENVNLNSNSGPNSFAQKLVREFQTLGHSFVSSDYDSALCFIEDHSSLPRRHIF